MNDAEILSLVFVAVMAAFYLMFIRPIHKDQEKHRQQIRDLRPGDEVLTTSNFVARIRNIEVSEDGSTRISLELADGLVVTAMPAAILQRLAHAPVQPAVVQAGPDSTTDASRGAGSGQSGQAQSTSPSSGSGQVSA